MFDENLGYARAMNRGFAMTRGEVVCVLNADVELHEDYLLEAASAFEENPRVGMVTGAIYRLAGGRRTRVVDSLGVAVSRSRVMHDVASERVLDREITGDSHPLGVSGCAALYRRAMLVDVADEGEILREAFGSYYEDVDLSWRARLRGWEAVCRASARAWHVREASLQGALRACARRRAFRNRLWTLFLNENPRLWLRDLPRWLPHELFQLAKVLRHPSLALAGLSAVRGLPWLLAARRRNRRAARLTRRQEASLLTAGDGSLLRRMRRKVLEGVTRCDARA